MGYRSNVGIKVDGDGYQKLFDVAEKQGFTPDYVYKNSQGEYTLIWEWRKWFPFYPEVQAVENVLNEFEEEDREYSFVRIGEETDDMEERGNAGAVMEPLWIERTIHLDDDQIQMIRP